MRQMSKKGKIAIVGVLGLLVIAVVGTTIAMLQKKTDPVQNDFAGAAVNIGVIENGKDTPLEDGDNTNVYDSIVKDQPVGKEVSIKNIDSAEYPTTDTYVRVRLVPIFRNEAGETVPADMSKVSYTYGDDGNWKKEETAGGETYYYYTRALAPDDVSGMLITSVTYTGEVPEGTTFELQVLTEGIAANQKDSLSAWGLSDFNGLEELV